MQYHILHITLEFVIFFDPLHLQSTLTDLPLEENMAKATTALENALAQLNEAASIAKLAPPCASRKGHTRGLGLASSTNTKRVVGASGQTVMDRVFRGAQTRYTLEPPQWLGQFRQSIRVNHPVEPAHRSGHSFVFVVPEQRREAHATETARRSPSFTTLAVMRTFLGTHRHFYGYAGQKPRKSG